MIDEVSPEERSPSLDDAMQALREEAAQVPGIWHQTKTRRFGIHLSWCQDADEPSHLHVRILREYVAPYSADLIAVFQYLPKDLEIARARMVQTDKVPILSPRVIEMDLQPLSGRPSRDACTRCGRPRSPRQPLIGDEQICALCATPQSDPT